MKLRLRAWDKTTNQMRGCYGFNDMEREVYVCSVADDEFNGQLQTVHALRRSFDEVVVMQSTEIKDNLGNEIFEGDILRVISFEDNDAFESEVNFDSGAFCLRIKSDDTSWKLPLIGIQEYFSNFYVNVLGNIYDNPELLAVTE